MLCVAACCVLCVTRGLLFVVCCKLFVMCRCVLLFVVCCLRFVVCYSLCVVICLLFVVCYCLLVVACCSLFVAGLLATGCLLLVVCSL